VELADQIAKEAAIAGDASVGPRKTRQKIRERQRQVDYGGDLREWLRRVGATLFD